MSMGRKTSSQPPLWVPHTAVSTGPRHTFYEKLNELLEKHRFDTHVEGLCQEFYAPDDRQGRRSIPPGVYFRMLLIGYFEGIESERGICWRCADSLSLRGFLGLEVTDPVPDHSSLSRIRTRLAEGVYDEVFRLVLSIVEREGLLKGRVVGVDSTYLRADASMKAIVRRETGESYAEYLKTLARAQGIENPTDEDARRMDRKRKKKTPNAEWRSSTDPEAKIARLKDGRTRLAYKPEHVVDLDTGAILAAEVHPANVGDTQTIGETLEAARTNVSAAVEISEISDRDDDDGPPPSGPSAGGTPPSGSRVVEVVADKGYHSARVLLELEAEGFRPYIPEQKRTKRRRWSGNGGQPAARAVYRNRQRSGREKSKALHRRRGELVERPFALICETGGARRTRLRGRENVAKRYKIQVAAANLGLVLRRLLGVGTPRELWNAMRRAALAAGRVLGAWMTMMWAVTLAALVGPVRVRGERYDQRLRGLVAGPRRPVWRIGVCSTGC